MSYVSSQCNVCGENNSSNITFFTYSNRKYISCNSCIQLLQDNIIPSQEFENGIILFYNYYDINLGFNETVYSKKFTCLFSEEILLRTVINHYINFIYQDIIFLPISEIIQKIENEEIIIKVPIFYVKKIKHRKYPEIDMYSIIQLYQNNNNIGYYEFDETKYQKLNQKYQKYVRFCNNILFNLMLKYNDVCKILLRIWSDKKTLLNLLPEDIMYLIIKHMKI